MVSRPPNYLAPSGGCGQAPIRFGDDLDVCCRTQAETRIVTCDVAPPESLFFGARSANKRGDSMLVSRLAVRSLTISICVAFAIALVWAPTAFGESAGAYAWGEAGRLGIGEEKTRDVSVPVAVSGLTDVTGVAAGAEHALARLGDGTVMAWGANGDGQLGTETTSFAPVPVPVPNLSGVAAVAAAGHHSLALLDDGTVVAWGQNSTGELGNGTTENSSVPVAVSGLSGVKAISASTEDSYALLSDGTVEAWGADQYGQLGDGNKVGTSVPVAVSGLSGVVAISAGDHLCLALLENGEVRSWGRNEYAQLGTGQLNGNQDTPVAVKKLRHVTAVSVGDEKALALEEGHVLSWGHGDGLGNRESESNLPTRVEGLEEVTTIVTGGEHSLAQLADGKIMTWGDDEFGALGDGHERGNEQESDATPRPVCNLEHMSGFASGEQFVLAYGAPNAATCSFVIGVAPSSGSVAGGTAVEIHGVNFSEASAVDFGSVPASSFVVNSDTSIAAVSPAGGPGPVNVTVTRSSRTSPVSPYNESDFFNYIEPEISGVRPDTGRPAGGTKVTIVGRHLAGATEVLFGTTPAESFSVEGEDFQGFASITAVAPPGTGTVDVRVTTPDGSSEITTEDEYTYEVHPPTIRGVRPSSGALLGGTEVEIDGSHFTGTTEVLFGTKPAESFSVNSDGEIFAVAPPGTGTVDIRVINPEGASEVTGADTYSYEAQVPVVRFVRPETGPSGGGTSVEIFGSNFTGATKVMFGTSEAQSFSVTSRGEEIIAVSPAHSGGTENVTVNITVTTPEGTSNNSSSRESSDEFTYFPPLEAPEYGRCLGGGMYRSARCTTTTGATHSFEWYPAFGGKRPLENTEFTLALKTGTVAVFQGASDVRITCKGLTGNGEYTSAKTIAVSPLTLTGCESSGSTCTSAGQPAGEIVTTATTGVLGVSKLGKAPIGNKIGTALTLAESLQLAVFLCGTSSVEIQGSIILPLHANVMKTIATINLVQSNDRQKPENFVNGPKQVLMSSFAGGPFKQMGLSATILLTSHEAIEISSLT